MKAVILAAGTGERLRPLSAVKPKPLFPVVNRPVIDLVLRKLKRAGTDHVYIHLHHLPDQIENHLERHWKGRIGWHTVREKEILGTTGGIANFHEPLDGEPYFLVHNSDVVSDVPLADAIEDHVASDAIFTLVLVDHPPINTVVIDRDDRVSGFGDRIVRPPSGSTRRLTYTGIAIASPALFGYLTPGSYSSLTQTVFGMLRSPGLPPGAVRGFVAGEKTYWRDIGTVESYWKIHHELLLERAVRLQEIGTPVDEIVVGRNCRISEKARFTGFASIGHGCWIRGRAFLESCIVWEENLIHEGFEARNAVIGTDGLIVQAG